LSSATRERPIAITLGLRQIYAIAPPLRIESSTLLSDFDSLDLSDFFRSAIIAIRRRCGFLQDVPQCGHLASSSEPRRGAPTELARATVDACARCAAPKPSFTHLRCSAQLCEEVRRIRWPSSSLVEARNFPAAALSPGLSASTFAGVSAGPQSPQVLSFCPRHLVQVLATG